MIDGRKKTGDYQGLDQDEVGVSQGAVEAELEVGPDPGLDREEAAADHKIHKIDGRKVWKEDIHPMTAPLIGGTEWMKTSEIELSRRQTNSSGKPRRPRPESTKRQVSISISAYSLCFSR